MTDTLKYDDGKSMPMLTPVEWDEWLTDVFMVGFKRHGEGNWKKVDQKRWENALLRHWRAHRKGQLINKEDDGVYHLAQVAWNALAILSAITGEDKEN